MNVELPPIDPVWFVTGLFLPAAIAAGITLAVRWVHRPSLAAGLVAVGLLLGYAVGFLAVQGWPWRAPLDALDWWALVGVPATAVLAMAGAVRRVPGWAMWVGRVLIAGGLVPLMLRAYLQYHWDGTTAAAYSVAIPVLVLAVWAAAHALRVRGDGGLVLGAMAIQALAVAAAIGASGSLTLGQHAGTVAAVVVAVAVVGVVVPTASAWQGVAIDVAMLLIVAALMQGRFFAATMTDVHAALLLVAPAAVWGVRAPRVRTARPWRRRLLAMGAVAFIAGIGLGLAAWAGWPSQDPDGDLYEGYDYGMVGERSPFDRGRAEHRGASRATAEIVLASDAIDA